jgi:hypothetical protein
MGTEIKINKKIAEQESLNFGMKVEEMKGKEKRAKER